MSTVISLLDELLMLYSQTTHVPTNDESDESDEEVIDYNDYDSCTSYFTILLGDFANTQTHYNIKQLDSLKNTLCSFFNKIKPIYPNTISKLLNEEEIFVDNDYYNDDKNNHIRPLYLFVLKMFEESRKLCHYSVKKKDWIYKQNATIYTTCQIYWDIIKLFIYNGANCNRYYSQPNTANPNNIFAELINAMQTPKDKIFKSCNKFHDTCLLLHILYNWKDYHKNTKEILDEYLQIIWYLLENDNDIQHRSILNICYYEQDASHMLKPAMINGYFLHSSFTSPFVDNADFHCHDITDPLHKTCTNQCVRNRDQTDTGIGTNNNNNELLENYMRALVNLFVNDEEEQKGDELNSNTEKKSDNIYNTQNEKKEMLLDSRCMIRDIYCLKKLMYYGYDLIYAVKYDKNNHLLEDNTENVLVDLINTELKKGWSERFLEKSNKLIKHNHELVREQRQIEEDRTKWIEKRRVFLYVWILRTMGKVIKKEYFDLMCCGNTLLNMLPTFEQMEIIMDYIGNNYCKKYEYLFSKMDNNYLILNALNTLSEITIWELDRVITNYCFNELSDKELQLIAYKSDLFSNKQTRDRIFKRMCYNKQFMKIYYNYIHYEVNIIEQKYVPSITIVFHWLIRQRNNNNICVMYGEAIRNAKPVYISYFWSFVMLFKHICAMKCMKEKDECMRKLFLIYPLEYIMSEERKHDLAMQELLFRLLNGKQYVWLKLFMKYKVLNVMCLLNELKLLKKCLMRFSMDNQIEFLDQFLFYLFKNIPKCKTRRRNIAWLRKLCRDNIELIPKNNRTDIEEKSVKVFQKYCQKAKR